MNTTSTTTPTTMEQMMTQAFRTALAKCQATNKYTLDTTFEEFADELTRDMFAILFPRPEATTETVQIPTLPVEAEEVKTKTKTKTPKKKEETPAAAVAPAEETKEEVKEKKPRAKKAPAPHPTPADPVEETKEDVKEKKPRAKKAPAPAPAGEANFDKFTPTETKKLKAIATELKVDADKKQVVAYLNALSKEDFHGKKLEEHFRDALTPTAAPPAEEAPAGERECLEIEFKGKTYIVDPETKRVYVEKGVGLNVYVGHVGAGDFADLVIPADA